MPANLLILTLMTLAFSEVFADFDRAAYDQAVRGQFPDSFKTLENEQRVKRPRGTDGLGVRLFSNPKEDANDWGLLVVDPAIDHVWMSTSRVSAEKLEDFEGKANFPSLKALEEKQRQNRFSGRGRPPGKLSFTGVLLGKSVETVVKGNDLRLPLLVSGTGIYRAQSACLSENGFSCVQAIPGAVTAALADDRGLEAAPVINALTKDLAWGTLFTKPFLVLVEYRLVGQSTTERESLKQVPGLVHPGYSPTVLKFEKALFDQYRKLFGVAAGAGVTDFVNRVRIGDCDTTAVTVATLNPQAGLLIAIGNMPTPTGFVDISTANHGWNSKIDPNDGALESIDLTPGPSYGLTFALNDEALNQLLPKIAALNQENFAIESLFEKPADRTALSTLAGKKFAKFHVRQIVGNDFDVDRFELDGAPHGYSKATLQKTHLTLSSTAHPESRTWGNYFKREDESVFLQIDRHLYWGRPGELVFDSYRLPGDASDRIQLADDRPKTAEPGKGYFTFNFDIAAMGPRTLKTAIVEYKVGRATGRRGYLWPTLTEPQMLAVWPEFQSAFPQIRNFDPLPNPGPNDRPFFRSPNSMKNGADRTMSGYGVLEISPGDRAFVSPYTAHLHQQYFQTAPLVKFWRDHGYPVIPTYKHQWTVMMYPD